MDNIEHHKIISSNFKGLNNPTSDNLFTSHSPHYTYRTHLQFARAHDACAVQTLTRMCGYKYSHECALHWVSVPRSCLFYRAGLEVPQGAVLGLIYVLIYLSYVVQINNTIKTLACCVDVICTARLLECYREVFGACSVIYFWEM